MKCDVLVETGLIVFIVQQKQAQFVARRQEAAQARRAVMEEVFGLYSRLNIITHRAGARGI